jgi:SIR2-like domain/TIR domain
MTESPLRIFINYCHEDTWGEAMLLGDRLANRFGNDNVFLDVRTLQPGMEWLEEIKSQRASCPVFLALIGPRWTEIMNARARERAVRPAEDYVRFEIEYALQRRSGIRVIPVLVGNSVRFAAAGLPRALQPLTKIEAEYVRPKRFEQDLAHLIETLTAVEPPAPVIPELDGNHRIEFPTPLPAPAPVQPPDDDHYELVLRYMVDEGNLVPFLGSRLPGKITGSPERSGSLPDSDELAVSLARRFGVESMRPDLPVIAQYVYLTKGRPDLYTAVRQILTSGHEPGPVHRFLARFPRKLEELGADQQYQLIVSTSFDTALEQAFDEEREPYDLAVYMASGQDKGKFVHFPYDGSPEPVSIPNAYGKFPIGDYGELERTVIVKIHGAVDDHVGDYRWKENYVITEDHYIDYLSKSPIESFVPVQILDKLRDSHCLFLGYTMREWNLRVFLKRIWRGEPLGADSWAIEPGPDVLEKKFWAHSYVDLYAADLTKYVDRLAELLGRGLESAEP